MQRPDVQEKLRSRPRTDAMKQKLSKSIKGRKFVTNGLENHQVNPEDIKFWLEQGYWLGLTKRLKK